MHWNSVRCMITCYVWMTGFGNFSFFYFKGDFGWLRVVQMLWRLNFAVLLLMLWHGNTYILYYICPLHTFYFLMTYTVMAIGQKYNHTKWGVRAKIFACVVLIYLLWDVNGGAFDWVFAWLGTSPVIGAGGGTVWEWYFRTSLDKYSSVFGMIFACNFPLCEQFFMEAAKKDRKPLYACAVVMGAMGVWWVTQIYSLEKLPYNMMHNYFAFCPLLVYIFFRNITPAVRGTISMSLHTLGKTTLETYLLQHHIWLTSNAKTLLTIVPGNPVLNFALCSILFFLVAKELYRLTMTLRGMMLPDDEAITLTNLKAMGAVFAVLLVQAGVVRLFGFRFGGAMVMVGASFYGVLEIIKRYGSPDITTAPKFETVFQKRRHVAGAVAVFGVLCALSGSDGTAAPPAAMSTECTKVCVAHISQGHWSTEQCAGPTLPSALSMYQSTSGRRLLKTQLDGFQMDAFPGDASVQDYEGFAEMDVHGAGLSMAASANAWGEAARRRLDMYSISSGNAAHCEVRIWKWDEEEGKRSGDCQCPDGFMSRTEMNALFSGKTVTYVGDSNVRNSYHAMNDELSGSYDFNAQADGTGKAHADLSQVVSPTLTTRFIWAPYVANITSTLSQMKATKTVPDVLVVGAGLWDVLYVRDNDKAKSDIRHLKSALQGVQVLPPAPKKTAGAPAAGAVRQRPPIVAWVPPLTIIDKDLRTDDKKEFMTEAKVSEFRHIADSAGFSDAVSFTIRPQSVCEGFSGMGDGVHYQQGTYHVLAQIIANGVKVIAPPPPVTSGTYKPKATGPMSFPVDGFCMVVVAAIMLFTMDSFFGVGYGALRIFGLDLNWEKAYGPILEKMGLTLADAGAVEMRATSARPSGNDNGDDDDAPLLVSGSSDMDEVKL